MRTRGRERESLREEEDTAAHQVDGMQVDMPEGQADAVEHNLAEEPIARLQVPGPNRDRQDRVESIMETLQATMA